MKIVYFLIKVTKRKAKKIKLQYRQVVKIARKTKNPTNGSESTQQMVSECNDKLYWNAKPQ